jgi:predicted NUDIX family NTP pyrophosphohydrolase
MATKTSAGLLIYRNGGTQVFLVHPGGPFWAKKDAGAWSIPKGEFVDGEVALEAAKREFREETGFDVGAAADFRPLQPIKQPSGKVIHAWLLDFDCEPAEVRSNTFTMEWPPKSGKTQEFPEVDRAAWFSLGEARKRLLPGQVGLIDQLIDALGVVEVRSEPSPEPLNHQGSLW